MEYHGVLCNVLTEIEKNDADFLPVLLLPLSVLFYQRPILIYPYQNDERVKPKNFQTKQSSLDIGQNKSLALFTFSWG